MKMQEEAFWGEELSLGLPPGVPQPLLLTAASAVTSGKACMYYLCVICVQEIKWQAEISALVLCKVDEATGGGGCRP